MSGCVKCGMSGLGGLHAGWCPVPGSVIESRFVPCRSGCGMMLSINSDRDYCDVCAAVNAGDVNTVIGLTYDDRYVEVAKVALYDDFGMNDEDVEAYVAHQLRLGV